MNKKIIFALHLMLINGIYCSTTRSLSPVSHAIEICLDAEGDKRIDAAQNLLETIFEKYPDIRKNALRPKKFTRNAYGLALQAITASTHESEKTVVQQNVIAEAKDESEYRKSSYIPKIGLALQTIGYLKSPFCSAMKKYSTIQEESSDKSIAAETIVQEAVYHYPLITVKALRSPKLSPNAYGLALQTNS